MPTSDTPTTWSSGSHTLRHARLRLRMSEQSGRDRLDGGWWPQSRDLPVELANLVDNFPARFGRISRVLVSPPDWDSFPRRIRVRGRYLKVGAFPRDDTHVILLTIADRSLLRVLVVPPDYSTAQGEEALLAAATAGNAHSATDLLEEVTQHPDVDPMDHWSDDGESWWHPDPVAPSFRTEA